MHVEVHFKPRKNVSIISNDVESLRTEIHHKKAKSILFNVIHRPPNGDMTVFENFCKNLLSLIKHQKTLSLMMIWILKS